MFKQKLSDNSNQDWKVLPGCQDQFELSRSLDRELPSPAVAAGGWASFVSLVTELLLPVCLCTWPVLSRGLLTWPCTDTPSIIGPRLSCLTQEKEMFERVRSLFPTCESEQENRKEAEDQVFNLKIGNWPAGTERSYTTVTAEPLSFWIWPTSVTST